MSAPAPLPRAAPVASAPPPSGPDALASQGVRRFSAFSPLGVASGSDTSTTPTTPSLSDKVTTAAAKERAEADTRKLPDRDLAPLASSGSPEPTTTASAPHQGAIPGLLPSWPDTLAAHPTRTTQYDEPLPGEDVNDVKGLSPNLRHRLSRGTLYGGSSSMIVEDADILQENQALRYNVEVLKTLALQLASQLDLAQARQTLQTGNPPTRAVTASSVESSQTADFGETRAVTEGREARLVAALQHKDELIDALRAQLKSEERWYEETLRKTLEEKNNVIAELLSSQKALSGAGASATQEESPE